MTKKYEIIIKETTIEKKTCGKEWREGAGKDGGYGYTPEIEKHVETNEEIFRQKRDDIDLDKIIKAINGI